MQFLVTPTGNWKASCRATPTKSLKSWSIRSTSETKKVRYRMHTDLEGIVIKVEREDKTKSKAVWEELEYLSR